MEEGRMTFAVEVPTLPRQGKAYEQAARRPILAYRNEQRRRRLKKTRVEV